MEKRYKRHEIKPQLFESSIHGLESTERKFGTEDLPQMSVEPNVNQKEEKIRSIESLEPSQRKSVICSIEQVIRKEISDCEDSSGGSSLVLDDDSDVADDNSLSLTEDHFKCEPSADPSEIECVVTDTSGDENSDFEEIDSVDNKLNTLYSKAEEKQLSCSLCDYEALESEGLNDLLKHLHTFHKFLVRGLSNASATSREELDSGSDDFSGKNLQKRKKVFICVKNSGGCGAVFFSKQGLVSHHSQAKAAGSSCWVGLQTNYLKWGMI